MDLSILQDYYFSSYQNYSDFQKIEKCIYAIEINGISNRMDLIELFKKYDFTHEKRKLKMTETKDKKYVKINGTIKVSKVLFSTKKPLLLQQGVSLLGYCLKNINENVKENDWGDDDEEDDEREIVRLKAEDQDFFSRKDMNFYIVRNKLVFNFIKEDFLHMIELLNTFLKMIYTDFMYILTQEKEDLVKKSINVTPLNDFTYLFTNKPEKSVLIKNYFYTIPCIRFNLGGEVFLLDTYQNLKKVGETYESDYFYNEQGFAYSSNHFVSIENEVQFNYELEKEDALVYYNHETTKYEVYTRSMNIYTDEIVDGVFTRKNYMKDVLDILYLFFSKVAMSKERIKYVTKVLSTFRMKGIVKRFCKDLDIDYLTGLSDSYKQTILDECKKNKDKDWLSSFFIRFLTYKYDESKPITIQLNETPNNLSDKTITSIHLSLEKELDIVHNKSFRNQDYHDTVVKFLDQMKFYSKELEKRVHIRGSITNAWMKCWEMIHTFKLVPDNTFTVFCNAEFPGAFVLALNHYIKTCTKNKKYEWYANSIWPTEELKKRNKEIYKDSFKLYEKYPNQWLMNEKNGGDISNINMINIIEERLKNKVDLYTSDVSDDETHSNIILGQFLCGLKVLKNGGTMVCRMSTFFKPFSMSLLFLLTSMFTDLCITKPMASRAICSECYIIGKNYKSNPFIINQLETILVNWTADSVNTFIEPITQDFYVKLVYASYYIYDREMRFLKKNIEMTEIMFAKNKDIKSISINSILQADQKEFEFRKGIIEHWKTMFKVPYLPKEDDL